ncbi:MAG: LemA family protein [Ignavibacteriales bacterium]|nr:LemA family protein [Ignavibacteriales bacterium]
MDLTIILIAAGVLLLIIILIYNSLINRKNKVEYAFSSIDVMLKKRWDLIPNLVAAVKEYMQHEREILTKITEMRAAVMQSQAGSEERFNMENKLSGMLGQLKVAVENYPNLKANENFLQLQGSLNEVEEQISAARRAYNASVLDFNNGIEMFPMSIFAKLMGYKRKASFEIPPEEREKVNVKDLFKA